MLNKCYFNQTNQQFFVTANVSRVWQYNRFEYNFQVLQQNELSVKVFKIHEILYFYFLKMYQFSICALLNACSVIRYD